MATPATLRAHDQASLDALPEHDAYFDPSGAGGNQRSVISDTSGTAPRRSRGACPRSAPTPRLT
jgi:hypothetical protein